MIFIHMLKIAKKKHLHNVTVKKRKVYNMLRENDYIKQFKNGNIHIKYDDYMIRNAERYELLTFGDVLDSLDCYILGEEFCLGNWAMGCMIYNAYSDLVYIFNFDNLENLKEGKTVILYGRKPDNEEREEIEKELSAD